MRTTTGHQPAPNTRCIIILTIRFSQSLACLSALMCDWLHLTEFLIVLQRRASPRRRPNPRYRWTTPGRGHIAPAGYQHPAAGAWPGRAGDRTSEIIRAWSIFVTCVHYPDLACGSALTFGYVGHIQGGIRHGGEWKYIYTYNISLFLAPWLIVRARRAERRWLIIKLRPSISYNLTAPKAQGWFSHCISHSVKWRVC